MSVKKFIDTNIAVYAIEKDCEQKEISLAILTERPCLSTQVILEVTNVCIKKLSYPKEKAFMHAEYLLDTCPLTIISEETIKRAFGLSLPYKYGHWDSLILASALEAECTILYSEDFQDGQVIEGVKIVNPFL